MKCTCGYELVIDETGNIEPCADCRSESFDDGEEMGHSRGYDDGHEAGHEAGLKDMSAVKAICLRCNAELKLCHTTAVSGGVLIVPHTCANGGRDAEN